MQELFEALDKLIGTKEKEKKQEHCTNDAVLAALGMNYDTLEMFEKVIKEIDVSAAKMLLLKLQINKECSRKAAEMLIYENKKTLDRELVERIVKDMEIKNV